MKAAYLTGIRKLEAGDAPSPDGIGEQDVLLRVDVVGVCGSDIHYFTDGRIGCQVVQFPWILGHELGATVLKVGGSVTSLRAGQSVAVDPLVACHRCDQCMSGRIHTCRDQRFLGCPGQMPGALAQYLVMPEQCCLAMPEGQSAVRAALTEPLAIALHTRNLAAVGGGAHVAILGCGPIGLCVLAALGESCDCRTFVTDLLDYRLELARRYGAAWTGNAATGDVVEKIRSAQPLGMDVVFECAGKQETLDQAVQLLKPGGKLVLVGIPPHDRISVDMNDLRRKELTLQCVRRQNECVEEAIEMLSTGRLDLDGLVTHNYRLGESQKAFDTVADYRDGVFKAMIHLA